MLQLEDYLALMKLVKQLQDRVQELDEDRGTRVYHQEQDQCDRDYQIKLEAAKTAAVWPSSSASTVSATKEERVSPLVSKLKLEVPIFNGD